MGNGFGGRADVFGGMGNGFAGVDSGGWETSWLMVVAVCNPPNKLLRSVRFIARGRQDVRTALVFDTA